MINGTKEADPLHGVSSHGEAAVYGRHLEVKTTVHNADISAANFPSNEVARDFNRLDLIYRSSRLVDGDQSRPPSLQVALFSIFGRNAAGPLDTETVDFPYVLIRQLTGEGTMFNEGNPGLGRSDEWEKSGREDGRWFAKREAGWIHFQACVHTHRDPGPALFQSTAPGILPVSRF